MRGGDCGWEWGAPALKGPLSWLRCVLSWSARRSVPGLHRALGSCIVGCGCGRACFWLSRATRTSSTRPLVLELALALLNPILAANGTRDAAPQRWIMGYVDESVLALVLKYHRRVVAGDDLCFSMSDEKFLFGCMGQPNLHVAANGGRPSPWSLPLEEVSSGFKAGEGVFGFCFSLSVFGGASQWSLSVRGGDCGWGVATLWLRALGLWGHCA